MLPPDVRLEPSLEEESNDGRSVVPRSIFGGVDARECRVDGELVRLVPPSTRGRQELGIGVEYEFDIVVVPLQDEELEEALVLDAVLRDDGGFAVHEEAEPEGVAGGPHLAPFLDAGGVGGLAVVDECDGRVRVVVACDPVQVPPFDQCALLHLHLHLDVDVGAFCILILIVILIVMRMTMIMIICRTTSITTSRTTSAMVILWSVVVESKEGEEDLARGMRVSTGIAKIFLGRRVGVAFDELADDPVRCRREAIAQCKVEGEGYAAGVHDGCLPGVALEAM